MSLLLLWRHSANIARLFAGTESRLGTPPAPSHASAAKSVPRQHHAHRKESR
jgi:glycerol-3-phosphate acyltransferase PlsY